VIGNTERIKVEKIEEDLCNHFLESVQLREYIVFFKLLGKEKKS